MAAKSSSSPAMSFILDYLKEKGDVPYGEVRSAASAAGHTIFPIMYGRAKSLLGLIDENAPPRRRRKPAPRRDESDATDLSRGRLRQGRGAIADSTADELSGFLARYRELEEERNRYRAALLAVEKMLKRAIQESEATI